MTIRKIITTSALVALIGSAGAVSTQSAFAADADVDFGADALTVQVGDAGHDFSLDYDAYVNEGDIAENVDLVEEAVLLDNEFDALNPEACSWIRNHPERFPLDTRALKRSAHPTVFRPDETADRSASQTANEEAGTGTTSETGDASEADQADQAGWEIV